MLHSHHAQLIDGMLDYRKVCHLLFENGNESIGVSILSANGNELTKLFIFWNQVFAPPILLKFGGTLPLLKDSTCCSRTASPVLAVSKTTTIEEAPSQSESHP
jgi:hypothetical protein